MEILIALAVWWAICALVGYLIAEEKGREGLGLVLALLFGPLGVLMAICLEPSEDVRQQRWTEAARIWQRSQSDDARPPSKRTHTDQPRDDTGEQGRASKAVDDWNAYRAALSQPGKG